MRVRLLLFLFAFTAGLVHAQKPRLVIPVGHTGAILDVAISPDNRYIVTGSKDNTAKLWDFRGHEIMTFSGHKFSVNAVAFSPDGKRVLTGSNDASLRIWSVEGGEPQVFNGHMRNVIAVAFAPDGTFFASGSEDKTVKIWSLQGGEPQTLNAGSKVNDIAIAADGKTIFAACDNGQIKSWSLPSGTEGRSFKHNKSVNSLACSAPINKPMLLAGGEDGQVTCWDFSGNPLQSFRHTAGITAVAFSPDGEWIMAGSYDDGVVQVRTIAGEPVCNYKGHDFGIQALACGGKETVFVSVSDDRTLRIWDKNASTLAVFNRHINDLFSMDCSPDGRTLIVGDEAGMVKVIQLSNMSVRAFKAHSNAVSDVAFSPDGRYLVTGSQDGKASVWDTDGVLQKTFDDRKGFVQSVAFSPGGDHIAYGTFGRMAYIQTLSSGRSESMKHPDAVSAIAFSPSGDTVLTGCADQKARLWDLKGSLLKEIEVGTDIKSISFAPDGSSFVIGGFNGIVQEWQLTGIPLEIYGRPGGEVSGLSCTGTKAALTILAGTADNTGKYWRDGNPEEQTTLSGHTRPLVATAILPDGKMAFTASKDGTLKLWDLEKGAELATIVLMDSSDWVVSSPNGLFDATSKAMGGLYYIQGTDIIELEQISERYFEPMLLPVLLNLYDATLRDVSSLGEVPLFPDISLESLDETNGLLVANLKAKEGGGIGKVSLFIGPKQVDPDVNPARKTRLEIDLRQYAHLFASSGQDTVGLVAFNASNWVYSQRYLVPIKTGGFAGVSGRGEGDDADDTVALSRGKQSLFVICIGTSEYASSELRLTFPDKDAIAMATAFGNAGKALFEDRVKVRLLTSTADKPEDVSTKTNIRKAFDAFAKEAKDRDVLIIYLSGHGVTHKDEGEESGQFYYLTKDMVSQDLSDRGARESHTVSSSELSQWLTTNPARKQVMIIDACNSGKIIEIFENTGKKDLSPSQIKALRTLKNSTGMFILTGSASGKVSYEASKFSQGLLTYSLLERMRASRGEEFLDVVKLLVYGRTRVPELAQEVGKTQKPILDMPDNTGTFAIGLVDESVEIPFNEAKKVFIRGVFLEDEELEDVAGVENALEKYFQEMTLDQEQSDIMYMPVNKFEGAYRVKGTYILSGSAISLKAKLRKDNELVGEEFSIDGTTEQLDALAEKIYDKLMSLVKQ